MELTCFCDALDFVVRRAAGSALFPRSRSLTVRTLGFLVMRPFTLSLERGRRVRPAREPGSRPVGL